MDMRFTYFLPRMGSCTRYWHRHRRNRICLFADDTADPSEVPIFTHRNAGLCSVDPALLSLSTRHH